MVYRIHHSRSIDKPEKPAICVLLLFIDVCIRVDVCENHAIECVCVCVRGLSALISYYFASIDFFRSSVSHAHIIKFNVWHSDWCGFDFSYSQTQAYAEIATAVIHRAFSPLLFHNNEVKNEAHWLLKILNEISVFRSEHGIWKSKIHSNVDEIVFSKPRLHTSN